MIAYELIPIERDADRAAYHRIRRSVLFGGSSGYLENGPDERKPENHPLLLKHGGAPVGTVRLDTRPGGKAIVRLVAIDAPAQRRGHGVALMHCLEALAESMGIGELLVFARPSAVGFYEKVGYRPHTFLEADTHGVQMRKLI